jgi:hypothetical protein
MPEWKFRDYLDRDGDNPIRKWIDRLPKKASSKVDAWILILEGIAVWPPQYISALKGCKGIYELRIVQNGVQYRPLGCLGPGKREFTILLGAVEKGHLPPSFCEVAQSRRQTILSDRRRTCEHQFAETPDSGEDSQ